MFFNKSFVLMKIARYPDLMNPSGSHEVRGSIPLSSTKFAQYKKRLNSRFFRSMGVAFF